MNKKHFKQKATILLFIIIMMVSTLPAMAQIIGNPFSKEKNITITLKGGEGGYWKHPNMASPSNATESNANYLKTIYQTIGVEWTKEDDKGNKYLTAKDIKEQYDADSVWNSVINKDENLQFSVLLYWKQSGVIRV